MIEDDTYKTSSQYRLWSFTHKQLQQQRTETNKLASEKVRAAFARARSNIASNGDDTSPSTPTEIETLTSQEEQRIVQWHCSKLHEMRDNLEPKPSSVVIATAIQYLRRFYLYNSPMTYHPKSIMVSCLWLAYKAEHVASKRSDSLTHFVNQLGITEEEVRAPEFMIMQALRFTLDVRHPIIALEGGISDIRLQAAKLKCFKDVSERDQRQRIGVSADKARKLLVLNAQMTDAYFYYTPAQMWLASLYAVDEALVDAYISHLFDRLGTAMPPIKRKLIDTLSACADEMKSYSADDTGKASNKELNRIGKKLRKCQNPEKVDIVAVAKEKMAEKREMSESDMEKKAKKRKLEREALERDGDVFGPDLKSIKKE